MSKIDRTTHPAIIIWGHFLGSFKYYIDGQIEQAQRDGAPRDAIYRRQDGTWATMAGVKNQDFFAYAAARFPELLTAAQPCQEVGPSASA